MLLQRTIDVLDRRGFRRDFWSAFCQCVVLVRSELCNGSQHVFRVRNEGSSANLRMSWTRFTALSITTCASAVDGSGISGEAATHDPATARHKPQGGRGRRFIVIRFGARCSPALRLHACAGAFPLAADRATTPTGLGTDCDRNKHVLMREPVQIICRCRTSP